MSATPHVWIDVCGERGSLLAMLETLAPPEWDTQSLYAEWRIRDVVGHLVSEITLPVAKLMGGMVKSRFRINKFIAGDACRKGDVLTNNWSMLSGLWCRRAGTILASHRCPCSKASSFTHSTFEIPCTDHAVQEGRMVLVASASLSSRYLWDTNCFPISE